MVPFNRPTAMAASIAAMTPGTKPSRSETLMSTAAESAATEATDKSKSPVMRITVIAMPMMDTSEAW